MKAFGKGLVMASGVALFGMGAASGASGAEGEPAGGTTVPCPATPSPPPGAMPPIPMATSIKPSDTSTSIVIKPNPADQIACGRTEVRSIDNVKFAEVPAPGGATRPLLLDIIRPAAAGKYPLVVYVTGGGFVMAAKENGLNLRR